MELDGLYLRVSRDKAGRIDWVDWLSGTDANPENLSPETPFVVEGADLILRNSDFTWVDASLADTQQIEITGVDGRIAEYSTRPGARTAMRLSFGISTEGVLAVDGEARSPPEPQRLPVGGRPAAHRAPPPAWGNAPQRHSGAHCD